MIKILGITLILWLAVRTLDSWPDIQDYQQRSGVAKADWLIERLAR